MNKTEQAKGILVNRNTDTETRSLRVYKLDVGCGKTNMGDDYAKLDLAGPVDFHFDLETCRTHHMPFSDDTFKLIRCSHVLEHIHNILPLLEELHRISAPDGQLIIAGPYGSSDNADEDPTHVRRFFVNSCGYFSQAAYGGADYGYRGDWKTIDRVLSLNPDPMLDQMIADGATVEDIMRMVNKFRNMVKEIFFNLQAVKPIRTPGTFREEAPINLVLPDKTSH